MKTETKNIRVPEFIHARLSEIAAKNGQQIGKAVEFALLNAIDKGQTFFLPQNIHKA